MSTKLPPGQWSQEYDRCVNPECKTPDKPHKAAGLCRACYLREHYRLKRDHIRAKDKQRVMNNWDAEQERKRRWVRDNPEKVRNQQLRLQASGKKHRFPLGATVELKNLPLKGIILAKRISRPRWLLEIRLESGTVLKDIPTDSVTVLKKSKEREC